MPEKTYRHTLVRRLGNRAVRLAVRLGLGDKHAYLLTVPGRKSGRPHSTPVRLIENEQRWLVAPYGVGSWVKNARAAGSVELSRKGRSERFRIEEVGPEEAAPVLHEYVQEVSLVRPYFDATPESPLEAFAAEAARHPVFRLRPG